MYWLLLFPVRAGLTVLRTKYGRMWRGLRDPRFRGLGLCVFLSLVVSYRLSYGPGPLQAQAARSLHLLRPQRLGGAGNLMSTTPWTKAQAQRLGLRGLEARRLQPTQVHR